MLKNSSSKARSKLFYTMEHLKLMQENKDSLYTIAKDIKDIKYVFDELVKVQNKYYYGKLPKDF